MSYTEEEKKLLLLTDKVPEIKQHLKDENKSVTKALVQFLISLLLFAGGILYFNSAYDTISSNFFDPDNFVAILLPLLLLLVLIIGGLGLWIAAISTLNKSGGHSIIKKFYASILIELVPIFVFIACIVLAIMSVV